MIAARRNHVDAIPIFVNAGAHVNARDNNGVTALMKAAYHAGPETVLTLLALGADPKVKDRDGGMAIDYARENPRLDNSDAFTKLEEMSR